MPWYFIPRVLKLVNTKMYVRNGYDGDSETVNVLARYTALKRCIAADCLDKGEAVANCMAMYMYSWSYSKTLWTQFLTNCFWEFHQVYSLGAVEDKDELIRFWDQ